MSAVGLQLQLKVAAFAAFIDKVADCGAAAINGFLKNISAAFNDFGPFPRSEAAHLFFRGQAGMKEDFTGIDVAYSCNNPAVQQEIFQGPVFLSGQPFKIAGGEFLAKWFRADM